MGYADYMNILISASCATLFIEDGGERIPYREKNTGIQYLVEFKNELFLQKVDFLEERMVDNIFFGGGGL